MVGASRRSFGQQEKAVLFLKKNQKAFVCFAAGPHPLVNTRARSLPSR
jgi:hypothetical protein